MAHAHAGDLQLDERVRERKRGRLEWRNVSAWVLVCLDVRKANMESFDLVSHSAVI